MPADAAALSAWPAGMARGVGHARLCINPLNTKPFHDVIKAARFVNTNYTDWPLGFISRDGREELILVSLHKQQRATFSRTRYPGGPLPTPLPT